MKRIFIICALLFTSSIVCANTVVVTLMSEARRPKKVVSFANFLYAEVKAEKKLLEIFIQDGRFKTKLSKEEERMDDTTSIRKRKNVNPDGSEVVSVLMHGCNGVFTDEKGVVYFWVLSSPRILVITSQDSERAYLVLKDEHRALLRGL